MSSLGINLQDWPEDGRNALAIMDSSGDTKLIWDPENPDEVENARRTFDDLKKKGFIAYKVEGKEGEKGEVLTKFDPKAARIIMAKPMRGG